MNRMRQPIFLIRDASRKRVAIGFVSAILWLSANPVSAEVIWRGDFETGTTAQWPGAPKSDSVKIVEEPVREGKYAVRIDGTNAARRGNNERIEFDPQPDHAGHGRGDRNATSGWSVFLPQKLSDDVHALGYFEARNIWRQLMSFEVRGEDILYSTRVPYALRWSATGVLTLVAGTTSRCMCSGLATRRRGLSRCGSTARKWCRARIRQRCSTRTRRSFRLVCSVSTSDVPETIIIDHAIEATTLEEVTPPRRKATAPVPGDAVIEKYLTHAAVEFNQRTLDGARTREEWESRRPKLKQEFLEMLGLWPLPEKTPLKATVTGTIERDAFVIEKLHFQSRPGLYVTGNLYRPKSATEKLPAVVFFMGHYNRGRDGHKAFMQDHGMWFASNGYVCLILDTLEPRKRSSCASRPSRPVPGGPLVAFSRPSRWRGWNAGTGIPPRSTTW